MAARRLVLASVILAAVALSAEASDLKRAESAPASAPAGQVAKTPEAIVKETVDKVIAILEAPSLKGDAKRKERQEAIRKILLGVFDARKMSASSLAKFKEKFSPAQFDEFTDLFSRLLFATYIIRIENYTEEKVAILGVKDLAKSGVSVQTRITSGATEIPIDYRLAESGGEWKGYDVLVEGVSLIKNYRSQFREILLKKDAAHLIEKLRKKVSDDDK